MSKPNPNCVIRVVRETRCDGHTEERVALCEHVRDGYITTEYGNDVQIVVNYPDGNSPIHADATLTFGALLNRYPDAAILVVYQQ